jgi:cytoskeletal protein RodZ
MNASNDHRPTRTELDRELGDLLGSDGAELLHAAADRTNRARRIEQATRNLSVDVAAARSARHSPRIFRRLLLAVPTLAVAVFATIWLMPDAPTPSDVSTASVRPSDATETRLTPQPAVTTAPREIAPQTSHAAVVTPHPERTATESTNALTAQVLDEIASQSLVDRLAQSTSTPEGVTSITDTDIDNLLAGL